jgi:hypothetical protein
METNCNVAPEGGSLRAFHSDVTPQASIPRLSFPQGKCLRNPKIIIDEQKPIHENSCDAWAFELIREPD